MSFAVECCSIYSDISTLIIESSVPNNTSDNAFAVSVFPQPVGPKNKKEPIGLLGSPNPYSSSSYAFTYCF